MNAKVILNINITLLLVYISSALSAQTHIPVESWRSHLTYHDAQSIAVSATHVYVASKNGLFTLEKATQKIKTLDKSDGLSDVAYSQLAYSETLKTLIIGYENGNMDLVSDEQIINIKTILNSKFKQKTIHHIYVHDKKLYVSTAFGITVINLDNYQTTETYHQLGRDGTEIPAFSCVILHHTLYVATQEGLKSVSMNARVNRQDFRNWHEIFPTHSDQKIHALTADQNNIYFAVNQLGIFSWDGKNQQQLYATTGLNFQNASQQNDHILFCGTNQLIKIQDNSVETITHSKIKTPYQAIFDKNRDIWIADQTYGLVHLTQEEATNYYPSEVYHASIFRIYNFQDLILGVSGGYNSQVKAQNNQNGFYIFEDGKWKNYNSIDRTNSTSIPRFKDITAAAHDPKTGIYYFASFGHGILIWNSLQNTFQRLSTENTSLFPNNSISDITLDSEGNLWITFFNVKKNQYSILQRKKDGSWNGRFARTLFDRFPLGILVDVAGHVWVRLNPNLGGGVLVWNPENGKELYLTSSKLSGNLPSSKVHCMHIDLEDHIWLGTDEGIRVFHNSLGIFDTKNIEFQPIVYKNTEFLNNQKITAITSDGGNRRWIGTKNGLYLYDESTSEIISQFDTKNSPLLSNNIRDITVNSKTGEVFIATDLGICSYQGTATQGEKTHTHVKVYPNPVRSHFKGKIAITGLATNANIKITDITGKLVHETSAQGGMATWNGSSLSGKSIKTGVYLIYSSDKNGQETFVTKILYIE